VQISFTASAIRFIGVISLLIALFCAGRIAVNYYLLADYPTTGVLSIATSYAGYPGPYEIDCELSRPFYTNPDGSTREVTDEEKRIDTLRTESCIKNARDTRLGSLYADIATGSFFTVIGAGILLLKRYIIVEA